MIDLHVGIVLPQRGVYNLLTRFDESSDIPLHVGIDFETYSTKLSNYAKFILAYKDSRCVGFIAYYLNDSGGFVYITQIVVYKNNKRQGIGHIMINTLFNAYKESYITVKLEVLKSNIIAQNFYKREMFMISEDRGAKILLERDLSKKESSVKNLRDA